jgi:hypothetical protein
MLQGFTFGEVLPAQSTLAYFITGEVGRKQMCITNDLLPKLARVRTSVPRLVWKQDQHHCFSGETRHGMRVLSAVRYKYGWRVFRRFFDECNAGIPFDLCYAIADHAALFPSSESAMDAAEIFSYGQYWDVAPLVWVNDRGEYRNGDPNLLLSPDFRYNRRNKSEPRRGRSKNVGRRKLH